MPAARRDILKILACVAGCLLLGAALAPWLYQAGKAFAEVTAGRDVSAPVAWLADAARRSDFERYFDRALLLSALVLLVPTLLWLRVGGDGRRFREPAPPNRAADSHVGLPGQPLRPNARGWREALAGVLMAAALMTGAGWVLAAGGWFRWRHSPDVLAAAGEALLSAAAVGVIEEALFRGILLGLFLRALRPLAAVTATSFLFAFVHFLEPPPGVEIATPEAAGAGFQLLGSMLGRFGDPLSMIGQFGPLFAAGLVLGYARCRTASLWLPAGLHAGWVLALKFFKGLTLPVYTIHPPARYLVGLTLREGIVPTVVVLAIGLFVHALTASHAAARGFDR